MVAIVSMVTRAQGNEGAPVVRPAPPRRRPVSPAEHARRVAWGKQWGNLVAESVKRALHSAP